MPERLFDFGEFEPAHFFLVEEVFDLAVTGAHGSDVCIVCGSAGKGGFQRSTLGGEGVYLGGQCLKFALLLEAAASALGCLDFDVLRLCTLGRRL